MASKIKKKKSTNVNPGIEITTQVLEYLTAALLMVFCVMVPLYTKEGYYEIGDAKFQAYKYIMIVGLAALLAMLCVYIVCVAKDAGFRQKMANVSIKKVFGMLSVTDYFVLAYMGFVIISVFVGGYYKEALWGYQGWYMGFMSQLSFVLLYFFVSRFAKYSKAVLVVWGAVTALVFLFGILHRLMIDPLGFYEGIADVYKAQFLSTLGQASWYGSYLAVALPIGIGVFLYAKNKYVSVLSAIFVLMGFATLVTQNSDSAYMALAGFMLVFFWFAVGKKEQFVRFMWVVTMFIGASKFMFLLLLLHPNTIVSYDFVTNLILYNHAFWGVLAVLLIICVVMTVFWDRWNYPVKTVKLVRNVLYILLATVFVLFLIVFVLKAKGMLPQKLAEELSKISYMNWHEGWGNGRGVTWVFTYKMFMGEGILYKLFGVGPDCYSSYALEMYRARMTEMWGDRVLTNAHNEWFNMLINAGILGAAAYIGIFVSAAKRFAKEKSRDVILIAFVASIASYMAYNFFCYQQVLCTPFIFMIIGMGEYILRKKE